MTTWHTPEQHARRLRVLRQVERWSGFGILAAAFVLVLLTVLHLVIPAAWSTPVVGITAAVLLVAVTTRVSLDLLFPTSMAEVLELQTLQLRRQRRTRYAYHNHLDRKYPCATCGQRRTCNEAFMWPGDVCDERTTQPERATKDAD